MASAETTLKDEANTLIADAKGGISKVDEANYLIEQAKGGTALPSVSGTVTTQDLTPEPDIQFSETDTSTVDISQLDAELEQGIYTTPSGAKVKADGTVVSEAPKTDEPISTPFADEAERIYGEILGVNEDLAGRADFEEAKREEFGVSELSTAQSDLVSQLRSLSIQSKAIENERRQVEARVQEESIGRGRTTGGITPLVASRQRALTLRQADIASQALLASATLSGIEGKLSNARRQVQEAVDAKYGAILQEKATLVENLSLLRDSGILDREETKRAETQLRKERKEMQAIEDEKQERADIFNLMLDASSYLSNLPNGSELIDDIKNAETLEEAYGIAFDAGAFKTSDRVKLEETEVNGRKVLYNPYTGEQVVDLGVSSSAYKDALERLGESQQAVEASVQAVQIMDNILYADDLESVVGGFFTRKFTTSASAETRGYIRQLKSITSLDGREKLKGSGQISDFEAGMLADSANSINFAIQDDGTVAMDPVDFVQQIKNLRGVQALKAGQPVVAIITDPSTGEPRKVENPTREDLNDTALAGYLIDFE